MILEIRKMGKEYFSVSIGWLIYIQEMVEIVTSNPPQFLINLGQI